jgi:hypothetical protein
MHACNGTDIISHLTSLTSLISLSWHNECNCQFCLQSNGAAADGSTRHTPFMEKLVKSESNKVHVIILTFIRSESAQEKIPFHLFCISLGMHSFKSIYCNAHERVGVEWNSTHEQHAVVVAVIVCVYCDTFYSLLPPLLLAEF